MSELFADENLYDRLWSLLFCVTVGGVVEWAVEVNIN